ncbi:titin homolog [Capsicum annuum]|uniref:titin homolog n=1 Tax=Capsicum annuum TaxID=4072 RepID=UPI001FB07E64|nr:titin homolog [Capsicum annuum]
MYYCITNPRVFYIIQVLIDSKVVRSGAKQTTTTKKNIMFDQYNNLDFGIEEDASNLPLIFCPSPGTLSWQDQCLSDHDGILSTVSKNVANYSTAVHGENVETMHDDSNNNNNNEPDPAHIVSKKLFCFADGHILDPHHVDLFCLDLLKRTYQLTIHRHNESDSFSLTKVRVVSSDLVQLLEVFLLSKVRLMFLIDEEYWLLTDELNLKGTGQSHLQMEVRLAFSLQNVMKSTMRYAISHAASSRKTNSQNVKSFVVCEFENELFLDQNADCRGKSKSFIPCRSNIKLSPCRVASVVYSLYLYGEVHEDFTILGCVFDIGSSLCSSSTSVKFSYRTEHHSSPGHSQDYDSHGTLSLSPLLPSEESPVGCFKIAYCPQRARLTSKSHRSPGSNKQKQHGLSPYPDSAVFQSSSNGEMLLEAFNENANASNEIQEVIVDSRTNIQNKRKKPSATRSLEDASNEIQEVIVDSQTNIQNKRKKPSTTQCAASLISLEDLKQNYGKKRAEAAERFQVSVSTFKRRCREVGILRWPPVSEKKRKMKEKEADNIDESNNFEEKTSAILNCTPKRQAVDCGTKVSSCYNSTSGTTEGIYGYAVDDMDSTPMGVQLFLDSTSVQPLNSTSCDENSGQKTKLLFDNLIALPLKDLIDPENETSMEKALSILADNLSLFSEEQAEQILELSVDFHALVHSWRQYSQSQGRSQKSLAETEKIRDLAETSVKDEESLNVRYEELERKEQELMAQLEAVQKEKAGIAEQRNEKSKQTKHLVSLAEEKTTSTTKEKHMMKIATTKLNTLVDQWTKIQSFFI